MEKLLNLVTGYVKIHIRDGQTERFLNLCMARGIILWYLQGDCKSGFTFFISVRHFLLLAPVRRKTGVQIHILEKHGLPFFFARSKKRKAFFLGILLCFLLLMFFSGRVWNIHIEGNLANSTPEILKFLEENGIFHGIKKSSLSCSSIASEIRENYPKTAWVSARIQGTRLIITIKEGDFQKKSQKASREPCNILASESGTIVKMITRAGVPQMKTGDTCKKGDLLVLGRLDLHNDSQEIFRYQYVHADADIYIKRKIPYYAELPLRYEKEIPAGKKKNGGFLKVGPLYLEWKGQTGKGWKRRAEEFPLRLTENFILPVSTGRITCIPYQKKTFSHTEQEAKAAAFQLLQNYEEKLMEKGVQISANNVKIEVDHLICVSRGTLEIIEKIGTEAPVEKLEQPEERTTENG